MSDRNDKPQASESAADVPTNGPALDVLAQLHRLLAQLPTDSLEACVVEAYRLGLLAGQELGIGLGQRAIQFGAELAEMHLATTLRCLGSTSVDEQAADIITCADRCYGCGTEDLSTGRAIAAPRRVPMLYCTVCAAELAADGVSVEVAK